MFKPDIFSNVEPSWSESSEEIFEVLSRLINTHYSYLGKLDSPARQIGGQEINSNNFLVQNCNQKWVVKRWSAEKSGKSIESVLQLCAWLNKEGIPVPMPLKAKSSSFLVEYHGNFWATFLYQEGRYFSGGASQLSTVAQAIGELYKKLKDASDFITLGTGPRHFVETDREIVIKTEEAFDKWQLIFGSEEAQFLEAHWASFKRRWTRAVYSKPNGGVEQISHYDLHPHNILMDGDRITAFLDFDGCQFMPVGYGLGFACLKLCRQSLANEVSGEDASTCGKIFIDSLYGSAPYLREYKLPLGQLAEVEVMRRIIIILRLNLIHENKKWNHVLRVQLAHLEEIDAIFSEYCI